MTQITTIDAYIATFEPEVQERMRQLRAWIQELAPEAQEKISWGMATFTWQGNLVHFAGQTKHLGLYPGAEAVEHFTERLRAEGYKFSKGAIQLPYSQPLPEALVREIIGYCVEKRRAELTAK